MDLGDFSLDMSVLGQENLPEEGTVYDLLILGGGPAAMTAAVYAARKLMKIAILTVDFGGQVGTTSTIENYLGFQAISGEELVAKFKQQMEQFEIPIRQGEKVAKVEKADDGFKVRLANGTKYFGRTVVVATGKRSRSLNVPGEKKFAGKGVAYCSTCDAPFFKDRSVVVAGGGNSGFTAALDLLKVTPKVAMVNFNPGWQGDEVLVQSVKKSPDVNLYDNTEIVAIEGESKMTGVRIKNRDSGEEKILPADGIFIEIGLLPNSDPVIDLVKTNPWKEVIVDCNCRTSVEGVFGAGDVSTVPFKQIVISAGEGAKAALAAYEFLTKRGLL